MISARRLRIGILTGVPVYDVGINQYVQGVWRGICAAARQRNVDLLLACGLDSPVMEHGFRPAWPVYALENCFVPVGPWNTDGLIALTPLNAESRSQFLQEVQAQGHPVVFVGAGEEGPTVAADNAAGIWQAVEHLIIHHGHQDIAFIAGESDGGDSIERLRAYQAVLQHYGLPRLPDLVAYGCHSWDEGWQAMEHLLANAPPFTALVASNDVSARAALQVLWNAGKRVPEDVALTGFDDQLDARATQPPLTTVHHPMFEMGQQALELIWRRIVHHEMPPALTRIPMRLVIRQSCGCTPKAAAIEFSPFSGDSTAKITEQLAQAMAEAVATETSYVSHEAAYDMTQALIAACLHGAEQASADPFNAAFQNILRQIETLSDDSHAWQAALSLLQKGLPALLKAHNLTLSAAVVEGMFSQARIAISASVRRQYSTYVIQRGTDEAVSRLTARLLAVMDETQLHHIVTEDLPPIGIDHAHMALFEAEGSDPVAWSILLDAPSNSLWRRFRSREFPPAGLFPDAQPMALAVLPLVFRDQDNLLGFVTFEASNLTFYQALLAQHLAAALKATRLYQEMAEARQQAEEANRLKSHFLSTVSHELRTPLSLIAGLSEMLIRNQSSSLPNDLERIHASAAHLGRLIRDVLDLASSEMGELRLHTEPFNLTDALHMAAETGEQLAREKGLRWSSHLPVPGPWVWGDRTRLRQVALNLISNAVKFTTEGEVSLSASIADGYVTIEVCDTGLGIPPDEQAHIFGDFRQSTRTAKHGHGGLGLGLAISKRLVELHHGEIAVESTGQEGGGSRFYVRLPVMEGDALALLSDVDASQNSQRVILFSQSPDVCDLIQRYLTLRGFEIDTYAPDDVSHLLPSIHHAPPVAIVLDLQQPEHGWHIFQALKENPLTRAIPVLFYALTVGQDVGMLLEMDYLTKPVGTLELAEALQRQDVMSKARSTPKTILIVDDEPYILEMHTRMVQSLLPACQVLQASHGRTALAYVQEHQIDLILLDLMMPEIDGFDVLEALQAQESTRSIPIIVLTARTLSEVDMARLNRGVVTVLSKGVFTVKETLNHIEAALDRSRRQGSEAQRLVRKAMAYIHAHYSETLTRQDIAQHVNVNAIYLTRLFHQELNMPPMTYLTRHRLRQAKTLLAEGNLSISEVALAVGFEDSAYFSRVFRKEMGIAPSMYQRGQHTDSANR